MQYKARTFFVLLLIIIWIGISNVIQPLGISRIVGKLTDGETDLSAYTGVLLLAIVPSAINNLAVIRALDWLDWSLDAKCGEFLSKLAFTAVINQSMTFHNDRFSGSLTSAANKLPHAFINLKSGFVWDLFPLFLTIIFSVTTAFFICPPFAAVLAVYAIVYLIVAIFTYYKTRYVDENLANAENKQTGQLADAITNELSVKSYARENFEKRRFSEATKHTREATFATARVSLWRNMSMNVVILITYVLILFLIVMSKSWFNLSIENTVFLYSLSNSLLSNMWTINHILRNVNRSFGDAKEMVEILDLPYIIDDKTDKPLKITDAKIEFKNITFGHEKQKGKLFSDFNLTVLPGERIGLVGVSGSGKTTLTKLLLRFDDVKAGGILIDDQDIRDVTQNSLRNNIAYVPQETALFHRSIAENIAYAKPNSSMKEIKRAAKLANAEEFIKDLPDGYKTLVGERGVKLSGGQRQRVAIARAILKDAPILVLDEATSALDSESEALIQEALNNLMKDRTSIVIAHRLSTVANLDRIVVLKDGKIIEQGTHKELLKKNGAYKKLWSRQSGAFLK